MKIIYKKILILYENRYILYNRNYNSLLSILEANNLKIDFHCRSGYCGICRLKLIKGTVKYHNEPLAFLQKNEILPCSCLPINNIQLDR
ncbi:class I ribonucleotide reductase maintenance protein YfaE [Candidatus Schneideria nysicola]|uniref:class I ribonucleotide reductase maintenance protein YfaE n=1 Tax=Candidatus Schneideria nysicola TaxID=1081631 RepID=UPI001CAA65EB|nr:class I ribonucleotide reductase maintenance protein YfaE [Candidatus Schneideria nysicola]UAJ65230.1 2Fe-2S ferredoxin-like protein [Candidatus Schneideria nysicola]UAJ66294.1 2Fe-2S ferredoxin-like protein [Candidatus Schneideria nysicola]